MAKMKIRDNGNPWVKIVMDIYIYIYIYKFNH